MVIMTDAKFKLEDILNKKKAPPQILDLANLRIETEEEFRNVIEKIPDYKIKPERSEESREQIDLLNKSMRSYKRFRQERRRQYVSRMDEAFPAKAKESAEDAGAETDKPPDDPNAYFPSDQQIKSGALGRLGMKKAALFYPQLPYQFADPCPESMRGVKISDLSSVDINWKMLTLARPGNKTDEEIFSKLVQLDKLRLQTRAFEAEQSLLRGGKDPFIIVKNPSASKGGVAETSIKVCSECLEEFCGGFCKEFQYDAYQRQVKEEAEVDVAAGADIISGKKKRGKKRVKKKMKGKKKKAPPTLDKMPVNKPNLV